MNILVRLPNWLGDAVMATFGLEILYQTYPNAHFYLIGSNYRRYKQKGYL